MACTRPARSTKPNRCTNGASVLIGVDGFTEACMGVTGNSPQSHAGGSTWTGELSASIYRNYSDERLTIFKQHRPCDVDVMQQV